MLSFYKECKTTIEANTITSSTQLTIRKGYPSKYTIILRVASNTNIKYFSSCSPKMQLLLTFFDKSVMKLYLRYDLILIR